MHGAERSLRAGSIHSILYVQFKGDVVITYFNIGLKGKSNYR